MYNVVYESDNGEKYIFGTEGQTVFDMDLGNGVPVNIGTSQGFSQVGQTIQSLTVSGRPINVKGVVYGNVQEKKKLMRKVISPFSSGKLIFENEYYTKVYVKNPPTFSPVKDDGRFSMQFFAPFPFFYSVNSEYSQYGGTRPLFRFPVNYSKPHMFGEFSDVRYKNIVNAGDVKTPFSVYLEASGPSTNIVIANLTTFQTMRINGSLSNGQYVNIYRNDDNVLKAELTTNGVTSDIISWIDEDSTLFELNVGDNWILVNDEEGRENLTAKILFNPTVVALYES